MPRRRHKPGKLRSRDAYATGRGAVWVFGYGSLMWNPGFPYEEVRPAVVVGHHRGFYVWSHHYRGSPERPGLVLALDRGGMCRGMAYRVSARHRRQVLAYVFDREMVTHVYTPMTVVARLEGGRRVLARTFAVDRQHHQCARGLSVDSMAALVVDRTGHAGPNRDYVLSTAVRLKALGVRDPLIEGVARRVRRLLADQECRAAAPD